MSAAYSPEPGLDRAAEAQHGESLSSVGAILSEITADISTLMRQEVELAKVELRQSATQAARGGGMLAGAAVAGHMVLLFLSIALWWGIGSLIGLGWSALVVALLWAVAAAVLASVGRSELKSVKGLPKTTETTMQIPQAFTGNEETR